MAGDRAHHLALQLRPDVKFHDGAPFTADDAAFSIERALAKTSQRASQLRGVTGVRKVDALTIDIQLSAPDAVLPDKLWLIAIMNKAWAEKHGVMQPQDYNGKQETYAVRNANGTGPFVLKTYEQDRRLVLTANPNWWGKGGKGIGNLTEAVYTVSKPMPLALRRWHRTKSILLSTHRFRTRSNQTR